MSERNITEDDVNKVLAGYVERVEGGASVRYKGVGATRNVMLKVWIVAKSDIPGKVKVVKSVAWEGE